MICEHYAEKEPTIAKLTDLDAKILKILLEDGRVGFDELATKCKVTKNVTWKRFRRMEKKGVINGATVQINYGHFGFAVTATLLISVNAEYLEQVMELIQKMTNVRGSRQYNSIHNIRVVAPLRDLDELDQLKQTIKQRIPTIGLKTYIWTGIRNMPENMNLRGTGKSDGAIQELYKAAPASRTEIQIDALDRQIAEKLMSDGRASFTQIAKQIGVSTETVISRYNKLKEKGALKVSIMIDPKRIGYASTLDFNIAFATPSFSNNIVDSLTKIPDIVTITKVSGDFDLQGTALVRDISEAFAIQDQIARISGITKVEASTRRMPDSWPTQYQHISTF